MEYVLRVLGALVILAGLWVGFQVFSRLSTAGVPLQNMIVGAISGAAPVIIAGILFIAFGTVIALLRQLTRGGGGDGRY